MNNSRISERGRGKGRRTTAARISFLRGLLDARMTRFPMSFDREGSLRAWGRTQLCFGSVTLGFDDEKRFMNS